MSTDTKSDVSKSSAAASTLLASAQSSDAAVPSPVLANAPGSATGATLSLADGSGAHAKPTGATALDPKWINTGLKVKTGEVGFDTAGRPAMKKGTSGRRGCAYLFVQDAHNTFQACDRTPVPGCTCLYGALCLRCGLLVPANVRAECKAHTALEIESEGDADGGINQSGLGEKKDTHTLAAATAAPVLTATAPAPTPTPAPATTRPTRTATASAAPVHAAAATGGKKDQKDRKAEMEISELRAMIASLTLTVNELVADRKAPPPHPAPPAAIVTQAGIAGGLTGPGTSVTVHNTAPPMPLSSVTAGSLVAAGSKPLTRVKPQPVSFGTAAPSSTAGAGDEVDSDDEPVVSGLKVSREQLSRDWYAQVAAAGDPVQYLRDYEIRASFISCGWAGRDANAQKQWHKYHRLALEQMFRAGTTGSRQFASTLCQLYAVHLNNNPRFQDSSRDVGDFDTYIEAPSIYAFRRERRTYAMGGTEKATAAAAAPGGVPVTELSQKQGN